MLEWIGDLLKAVGDIIIQLASWLYDLILFLWGLLVAAFSAILAWLWGQLMVMVGWIVDKAKEHDIDLEGSYETVVEGLEGMVPYWEAIDWFIPMTEGMQVVAATLVTILGIRTIKLIITYFIPTVG